LESDERIQKIDIKLSKKKVSVEGDLNSEEAAEIIQNSGFSPEIDTPGKGMFKKLFSS